ncbi:MAG: sensor histidine kinase [Candidatus Thorarchaeota archaeon]|jgi:signal transduction histidine kinase
MQDAIPSLITDVLLIELGLAFVLLVSVVLYRYSVSVTFRYWAIGWTIFGFSVLTSVIRESASTTLIDVLSLTMISIAAIIILTASTNQIGVKDYYPIYASAVTITLLVSLLSALLSLPLAFPNVPVQLILAYAALSTVIQILSSEERLGFTGTSLVIGFLVWGVSALLYLLLLVVPIASFPVAVQTTAFIWVGASMMAYYIQLMESASRMQYEISEVMSHLIQHDIRNYVQTASLALEAHSMTDSLPDSLLKVASKAMEDAVIFIEKMRQVSVSLSRVESSIGPITISPMIENATSRVQREYGDGVANITVKIQEKAMVNSNPLAEELLWNIIDNAVKQGSHIVEISCPQCDERSTTIQVTDYAGGVSREVMAYLNSPMKNSANSAPGKGLGLMLIKRLSDLCGAKTRASDTIRETGIVGTTFRIVFSTSAST